MPFSPKLARFARRALLAFAVFATSVAVFYLVENWRGTRAWRVCVERHTAQGDPVDSLPAPASLPAATNFMKTPLLDRLLFAKESTVMKTFIDSSAQPAAPKFEWRAGRCFDLGKYFARQQEERQRLKLSELPVAATPAAAVLAAQSPLEPAFDELRQALRERPASQLVRPQPISREEPFNAPIARFQVTRLLGCSLSVHACAMLVEKHADEAQSDVLAALRLARGFTDMPDALLVEAMIGTVMTNISLQPIWEGCQQHTWNEPQLEQLQRELAQISPLAALERAMRQERAGFVLTLESVPSQKLLEASPREARWLWRAIAWGPRGWVKQNCVAGVANMQAHMDLLAARGTPEFLSKKEAVQAVEKAFGRAGFSPYTFAVQMALVAYETVIANTAMADANVSLAITACALERYRLAHESYPERLDELIPTYIDKVPLDIIDGQPLRYRRTDDGKFVLYSIGLDGKDDGGKPIDSKQSTDALGDWVWPQAVNSR